MAQQFDLPLPEITVIDFQRSWIRFELVSKAKEWDEAKWKLILPSLLRSKLVDIYVSLDDTARGNLEQLKKALMKQAGLVRDPLTAGQLFMSRNQLLGEKVRDFVVELKKLFVESYPTETLSSAILLQHFLTGLSPPICRQLLLKGQPGTLDEAVKHATDAEYALSFESAQEKVHNINAIHKQPAQQNGQLEILMEKMTKQLEALQTKLKPPRVSYRQPRPPRQRLCWTCGEPGHLQRDCPLNEERSARKVGGWPRP